MQYNWESPAGQIASIKKRKGEKNKVKYFLTFLQSCPRTGQIAYIFMRVERGSNRHERISYTTVQGWRGRRGSYRLLWYLDQVSTDRGTEEDSGTVTLCNNKTKEILPQTRHTIHLYGDKHDPLFVLIYFFLNTMSALEINHDFTHDAFPL